MQIIGIVAVLILGILFLRSSPPDEAVASSLDIPWAIVFTVILMIAVIIAGTFTIKRLLAGSGGGVWTTVTTYPKIPTVALFVVLLYILGIVLHPDARPFLLSPIGVGILLLLIVGFSFFVILKEVFWKESKFTAIIMILILVVVLDVALIKFLPAEYRGYTSYLNPYNWGLGTQVSMQNDCSGRPETRTIGATITPINEKSCQLRGAVISGCVVWYDSFGRSVARTCEGPMPSASGIHSIRAETTATVRLNWCIPFTTGNLLDRCA